MVPCWGKVGQSEMKFFKPVIFFKHNDAKETLLKMRKRNDDVFQTSIMTLSEFERINL
jgi:hypothetical protein